MSSRAPVARLHLEVSGRAEALHILHSDRLQCRRGCSSCCVDDLHVFEVEAERIRASFPELLAIGAPHRPGACAFLDDEGACRIYEERPYVCRTQGLPLRWLEEIEGEPVELRDICPLNDADASLAPLESLPAEACWTLGPVEEELAQLQLACNARAPRVALRDLFAGASDRSKVRP